MDRDLAERLVGELEKHPPLRPNILPDRAYFIHLLASVDVPPSRKFYEEVKPNRQSIPDSAIEQHHFLSITRVLRNNLARDYQLSKIKEIYEAIISTLGIRDSDVWTRRLRINEDLVNMMTLSSVRHFQPYSLLAKLETFDELSRHVATRPLVIIPGIQDLSKTLAWEDTNTYYGKEGSLGVKSISKEQYLKS